jgi:DNA-binding NtrC family response regulator
MRSSRSQSGYAQSSSGPLAAGNRAAPPPASRRHANRARDPAVLVVDDDPGPRETFECALRSCGVHVATVGSGADAIALARVEPFDLILIDLELQDMRGVDVIRALSTPGTRVPFVLFSGFLTTDITVEAMRLGALDVLERPVSVDDLPRLLRTGKMVRQSWQRPTASAPKIGIV